MTSPPLFVLAQRTCFLTRDTQTPHRHHPQTWVWVLVWVWVSVVCVWGEGGERREGPAKL